MRCRYASAKLPCTVFYHADDCYNQLTKSNGDDENTSDKIDIYLYCDDAFTIVLSTYSS